METTVRFDKQATNLCKGIAISMMVYFHLFGATDLTWFQPVVPTIFAIFAPYGNMCVVFFSLLTGYGFAVSQLNKTVPYPTRIFPRLVRLYSGYWAIFIPAFFLVPLISKGGILWTDVYGTQRFAFIQHFLLNFFGLTHLVYGDGMYTLTQTWWYVSLAILIILALPLICTLWRRCGWGCFVLLFVLAFFLPDVRYLNYMPSVALGVCLAGSDGFVKLHEKLKNPFGVLVRFAVLFIVLFCWYRLRQAEYCAVLADTIAAWTICQFAFDVLRPIPIVRPALCWLGKHSGNVFYIHSFVFVATYFSSEFVFSFRYDWLIWVVTMAISCAVSIIIDKLKLLIHYEKPFRQAEQTVLTHLPAYESKTSV